MRIYISVDLEGVNGVLHSSQTQPGEPGYQRAVELMHEETNAIIEGLVEGGATEILVNDSHWDMRNLMIERLHPLASLVSGWQKPFSMVSQLDGAKQLADAACFVGYHTKAGTARGVLSHTYRAQVFFDIKINGQSVGETGLNAALAGWFGVPIALVTGDDALGEEVETILPGVTFAQTKRAVSRYAACCPPHKVLLAELKSQARQAIEQRRRWVLYQPQRPTELEITFFDPAMADAAELIPGISRKNDRIVSATEADYSVLFRLMLAAGALGASRKDPYF